MALNWGDDVIRMEFPTDRQVSTTDEKAQPTASAVLDAAMLAVDAADLLAESWDVAADVWSVTSWGELNRDGVAVEKELLVAMGGDSVRPKRPAKGASQAR